jgi:general secretion pathway protein E
LRELIHDRVSDQELTRHVRKTCPGIREDGRDKILSGVTTVQEILRVTLED